MCIRDRCKCEGVGIVAIVTAVHTGRGNLAVVCGVGEGVGVNGSICSVYPLVVGGVEWLVIAGQVSEIYNRTRPWQSPLRCADG